MSLRKIVWTVVVGVLCAGLAAFVVSCQTNRQEATQEAGVSAPSPDSLRNLRLQRGERAFLTYCAMCHGESGEGDGPMAEKLREQGVAVPAKLNDRARLDQLGHRELVRVISLGGAHTGRSNLMPPWGERLSPAVIDTIADFVMALPDMKPGTPTSTVEKYLEAPAGTPAEGRRLFVFYCSVCHGMSGQGNGPMADTLWARNRIRPRDLTDGAYLAKKTDQDLFVTISLGGGHAGKSVFMPAWTVTLPPDQIKDLISYIRAISGTQSRP
jgi:mono/diheme cytochrome c family protein